MPPIFVVLSSPHRDPRPRLEQVSEPTHPHTLLPHSSVKTYHVSILCRSSRLNVCQFDFPIGAPRQKMPACQVRSVVASNRLRHTAFRHDPLDHVRHPSTREAGVHFQRQALPCARPPRSALGSLARFPLGRAQNPARIPGSPHCKLVAAARSARTVCASCAEYSAPLTDRPDALVCNSPLLRCVAAIHASADSRTAAMCRRMRSRWAQAIV